METRGELSYQDREYVNNLLQEEDMEYVLYMLIAKIRYLEECSYTQAFRDGEESARRKYESAAEKQGNKAHAFREEFNGSSPEEVLVDVVSLRKNGCWRDGKVPKWVKTYQTEHGVSYISPGLLLFAYEWLLDYFCGD